MVFCAALVKFTLTQNWTIWESLLKPSKGNRLYSVYCTKAIRAVLTAHSLLVSTKHLIVVGAHPKGTCVIFSPPPSLTLFSLRLELRRNREEDLKASGEILRSELLLEQEDPEVCQVNWRHPPVRRPDLQQTCTILVNKCIIIWVYQTFGSLSLFSSSNIHFITNYLM